MLQNVILGALLDDGGREIVKMLSGLAAVVVLVLLFAVLTPVAVLTNPPLPRAPHTAADVEPGRSSQLAPPIGSGPIDVARRYLGVKYVFGGTDPTVGLDCSGLVQLVFRHIGIALPRTAQQQFDATPRVSREHLAPGDLVFFARTYNDPVAWITHVGIYVGDGMQINAPTEGQVVSIQPVFSGFWGAHYAGGGRVRNA
jgi:peptidoglycan DL-endopeptidase CwlO